MIGDEDRAALPADVVDAYPLSQIQTGMLVEMMAAGPESKDVYHNINSFRVPDEHTFSLPALRRAVDIVGRRHDILRTSMHLSGYTQALQLVHAAAELPIEVHDVRALGVQEQDRAKSEYVERERANLFDLASAPLMRIGVHIESDSAWRLTLSHCHAVTEGWTLNILLMELLTCYRQVRDGREVPAYEVPSVRYADFIAAELAALADDETRAFWQGVVAGHAPLRLPEVWGDPEGSGRERHGVQVPFADLEEDLRRLARRANTSLKSVLLAAHLKVLGSLTAEDAFHTGVVYHGRLEAPGADRVLGMHLNTLPFPAARASGTWQEYVERVYAQETDIWGHRRYPLPAIQRDSGAAQRLISVLFEHQDFQQVGTDAFGTTDALDVGGNEFALNVIAADGRIQLGASTDVISRENLRRLGAMYRRVLEAMAGDFEGDAGASCLPREELDRVLDAAPAAVEWSSRTTLELFSAQAVATPKAVAVISGDERITYRELDERSNRLAHHLRELGAGPGVIVGLHVQRSLAVHTAMLAVWKTGAAYVPVDPALPADRAAYMLTDAGAELVVTDSFLDSAREAIEGQPATALGHATDPEQLAYVLYTSGSTGRPKGVMISHEALHNLLAS
ncbi:condensation domain-containing protein, partial [Streptomyces sp. NPDC023588]|uniref:condensation domain-containing protein n=1 Tax=Streptomyces sp. NPDC023588 TaxID=3154907 RepID=UPI0033FF4136